jgi:hypothetical protein
VGKDGSMEYNSLSRGGFPGNETIVNAAETALMK